jgi:alkaline phosphatase
VNVASKAFRQVALYQPGHYVATLTYFNGRKTIANWTVREFSKKRIAKNVILFIGDGMTTLMQTAARLIAHKSINGKYQSLLQLDQMEALGHQMTHSIDSFITVRSFMSDFYLVDGLPTPILQDSANSATALYSGHKSTVNSLNVYADSSPDPFDDPKFETGMYPLRCLYPFTYFY